MNDCIPKTLQTEARVPRSTYRVQMHSGFTFADAQAIVPYLNQLGIGDLYASPIFEARPGSTHGYDVTRHDRLNPELGGPEAFNPFASALKNAGMGLLLDIVPNHMGVGNDSVWWQDVLENGRASKYSGYFDIDWTPLKADMQHKLLLPILGNQYGAELEDGNLQVKFDDGKVRLAYYDHLMPVAPRTIPTIFPEEKDTEYGVPADFRSLLKELAHIPPHETTEKSLVEQRQAQLAELKPRLDAALKSPALQPMLEKAAAAINGRKGDAHSFDALHALLEIQPYRLASWKTSSEQINYRRFFDVNDLVGLRMENPEVFRETHCLIRELLAGGLITGLRIDHCDGMFNPREYLVRLQELFVAAACFGPTAKERSPSGIEQEVVNAGSKQDWCDAKLPLYCVVEKILEPGEVLPRDWPVQGTSGYDFVHFANQLFIQSKNQKRFNAIYNEILGERVKSERIIYDSKRMIMNSSLSSETHVLRNLLSQIAGVDRRARDFTDKLLESVIVETIACFPVYRTYVDERGHYSEHDRKVIQEAIIKAKRHAPELEPSAFDFLGRVLLLGEREGQEQDEVYRDAEIYFALKFQQLTGPVMAKSVEDTSFYVYTRFISSNEVGSSMEAFGIKPEVLHQANAERQKITPHTMLTTSTHDTKRSEDVRCRLNVISEMPDEWSSRVRQWLQLNARHKTSLEGGQIAPDANEEYLLYQTIVGAWPWENEQRKEFVERIQAYMTKALSEAKVNVSWVTPHPEYTEAVTKFVAAILTPADGEEEAPFVTELMQFVEPVRRFGAVNSLAQLVLKATVPGVPDFYQGTDMWDLSLVDPDNRRPVDYKLRSEALKAMTAEADTKGLGAVAASTLEELEGGRAKLWAMHRTLAARNEHLPAFELGTYTPLTPSPPEQEEHVFAYLRGDDVVVILPRFSYTLASEKSAEGLALGSTWSGITVALPEGAAGEWTNIFTGEKVLAQDSSLALDQVFASFPVAVLVRARK
jgi:(1->4)-alpha-D-glucan 1-alpha-D-glucosylmutase